MNRAQGFDRMRFIALNEHVAVVQGREGLFLVNRHDVYIGRSLEVYGEYNALEAKALCSILGPGDNVIECGANIGSHTVAMARRVAPGGTVYAYEPQRGCYALLQTQIALNGLKNVVALNQGVGAQAGKLWLPTWNDETETNFGGVSLVASDPGNGYQVDVVDLDSAFPELPVKLLKVDVEGMEHDVLVGARQLISRARPILYVENDRFERSALLIAAILGQDYRLWWHIPPLYNPDNYFRVATDIFGNIYSCNMVGCHRSLGNPFGSLQEIKSPQDPHPFAS
jgi:FkbM family methyltransferase